MAVVNAPSASMNPSFPRRTRAACCGNARRKLSAGVSCDVDISAPRWPSRASAAATPKTTMAATPTRGRTSKARSRATCAESEDAIRCPFATLSQRRHAHAHTTGGRRGKAHRVVHSHLTSRSRIFQICDCLLQAMTGRDDRRAYLRPHDDPGQSDRAARGGANCPRAERGSCAMRLQRPPLRRGRQGPRPCTPPLYRRRKPLRHRPANPPRAARSPARWRTASAPRPAAPRSAVPGARASRRSPAPAGTAPARRGSTAAP